MKQKRMKTKGLFRYRTVKNPLEKAFAKAWDLDGPMLLPHLLYPNTMYSEPPLPTPRECAVAATLIQWLGSPVGQDFLAFYAKKAQTDFLHRIVDLRTDRHSGFPRLIVKATKRRKAVRK